MARRIKIIIDILMVLLLVALLPTGWFNPPLHLILGIIFIPIVFIHLLLNIKWVIGSIKNILKRKVNKKSINMLLVVIALIIVFLICIFTGLALFQSDYFPSYHHVPDHPEYKTIIDHNINNLFHMHTISSLVFIVLTIIHVVQNMRVIKSYFRKKKT
jgi:hypothetical protein